MQVKKKPVTVSSQYVPTNHISHAKSCHSSEGCNILLQLPIPKLKLIEAGDEFLNFHLIRNWSPSKERSH